MERRVPLNTRTIAGATLDVGSMGGYSVHLGGGKIGYVNRSAGDRWDAYRCAGNTSDEYIGRFELEEAVRRIAERVRPAPETGRAD